MESHPLRMRGLKPYYRVTNSVGWASHPLRMRGLKLLKLQNSQENNRSHPLRMRGLKQNIKINPDTKALVASFTDAWIETLRLSIFSRTFSGRILYGCVD